MVATDALLSRRFPGLMAGLPGLEPRTTDELGVRFPTVADRRRSAPLRGSHGISLPGNYGLIPAVSDDFRGFLMTLLMTMAVWETWPSLMPRVGLRTAEVVEREALAMGTANR